MHVSSTELQCERMRAIFGARRLLSGGTGCGVTVTQSTTGAVRLLVRSNAMMTLTAFHSSLGYQGSQGLSAHTV